jgi:LL-diaminopimelate aminotransferase
MLWEIVRIYKFELIKRCKSSSKKPALITQLIDMGFGELTGLLMRRGSETLSEEAGKPSNRWYADNGIPEFQEAAAAYLEKVLRT